MRIAPAAPTPNPLFVRVELRGQSTPEDGRYVAYEAVSNEVELGPHVHRMTIDAGLLHRTADGMWHPDRRRIEARDDSGAAEISAAVHEAYAGFFALGIAPDAAHQPAPPNSLTIRADEATWTFDSASAPAEAWAILRAASRFPEIRAVQAANLR